MSDRRSICALVVLALSGGAMAAPVTSQWATDAPGVTSAVAAADLSGWYATASTEQDTVEIRDVEQRLVRTIEREEMLGLLPWMTLDASDDGPRAMAWSDSGRSLFITVTDQSPATDGQGSDAVLRYDTFNGGLSVYVRAEIGDASQPATGLMHHAGSLWVGTQAGPIRVYRAERNDFGGQFQYSWSLPSAEAARGMAVARSIDAAVVVSDSRLFRVGIGTLPPVATEIGPVTGGRGVAFSEHFGPEVTEGAFVVDAGGPGGAGRLMRVPWFQVAGLIGYSPAEYAAGEWSGIADTACGGLLLAGDGGATIVRDSDDTRLGYEDWLRDELDQLMVFAHGLVSPDGEPAGWVIDGDVVPGSARFHPATPDGAAWVVMASIARDHLDGNQASAPIVRDILRRYAGQMPDGIVPEVSADGIMHHWYDPWTGGVKPGWDPEYATLSTMLLVAASDRARRFYGTDAQIVAAADEIVGRVSNWDAYIQPGSEALYFKGQPFGGPDFGSAAAPFHEGVLFVEQAATYGTSVDELDHWLDRASHPSVSYLNGTPLSTNVAGRHLPAFVSLYPWLTQAPFRGSPSWQAHTRGLLASHAAWTDDHGPDRFTVFSAGTTKPEWGGYHADSLSDHPGDVASFPSLLGFGGLRFGGLGSNGGSATGVAAYHAYRTGARQTFATGASVLSRRSDVDPFYTPHDAGLPDMMIGAIGIAERLKPGLVDAVLAVPYRRACPADFASPLGQLNFFDISAYLDAFVSGDPSADIARPFGVHDFFDISAYLGAFNAGCP